MKLTRYQTALGIVAAGALLTACGTDVNSTTSSPPPPGAISCATGMLTASGSTAQQNAMAQWIKTYLGQCSGADVNYGGGGSGQGVQQFQQGTVDFAGSDFPLASGQEQQQADARCAGGQAINLPMVPGPIAIGYHLPGVSSLNLSAGTLAKIFSGRITTWNDPALVQENPGVALPSVAIQTFHRSDGSGTSFNFTNYLAHDAGPDWTFGANKNWPAPGGQGAKGTAGIAQGVQSTTGGIGYLELSFATSNNIPIARTGNQSGQFVELTNQNVVAFLSTAKVTGTGKDLRLEFDYATTDPNAYPNVLVTYEIVCSAGNPPGKLALLKGFLGYVASGPGQQILPEQGYVSLPPNLARQVQSAVGSLA